MSPTVVGPSTKTVEPRLPTLVELGFLLRPAGILRRGYLVGRPALFLAAYWAFASQAIWPLALLCLTGMFISGVAVLNDLIHESIGVPQRVARVLIGGVAAMLLENGAAVRASHLQHHFGEPTDFDPEGYIDAYTWPRLLRECPRYRYRLWNWAYRNHPESRSAVVFQSSVHVAVLLAALAIPSAPLRVLVALLLLAGLVFPIVSARGPQNAWGHGDPNATIVRGVVLPRLLLGMVFHLEHHLYPQVPTYQLAELSRRLDPWLQARGVVRIGVW